MPLQRYYPREILTPPDQCGEERPACHNCVDRETECAYGLAQPRVQFSSSQTSPVTGSRHPSQLSTRGQHLPLRTAGGTDLAADSTITRMEEFQLLLYYMNHTVETMSNGSDVDVWRKAVPEQAVHHEFLMDGLLALSALHFASNHLDVRWRYVEFASRYQASALRKYTKALQGVTESNGHALFAYAIITMILALAFTTMHKDTTSNPIDDLVSFFRLLQGVGTVNRVSGAHLKEGPFQALWDLEPADKKVELQPDIATALKKLEQRAKTFPEQDYPDRRQVYLSSIKRLDHVFRCLETSKNLRHIMAWPAQVESDLLAYLRDGDPMARLIFLHYGVLLLRAHDRWWARDFGSRLTKDLAASLCALGPEWALSTEWARACVASLANGTSAVHVRK